MAFRMSLKDVIKCEMIVATSMPDREILRATLLRGEEEELALPQLLQMSYSGFHRATI